MRSTESYGSTILTDFVTSLKITGVYKPICLPHSIQNRFGPCVASSSNDATNNVNDMDDT